MSSRYASSAAPRVEICAWAVTFLAVSTCLKTFGATMDARTAMMTTTTRTSISVKAERGGVRYNRYECGGRKAPGGEGDGGQ